MATCANTMNSTQSYFSGHYSCNFIAISKDITIKVPKLKETSSISELEKSVYQHGGLRNRSQKGK